MDLLRLALSIFAILNVVFWALLAWVWAVKPAWAARIPLNLGTDKRYATTVPVWARLRRTRLYRATAPQELDDGAAAGPAGSLVLVRLVASTDPARISEKPTTAPSVKGSCSTATPSNRATAGL